MKRILQGHVLLAGIIPALSVLLLLVTLYSVFNQPKPVIVEPQIKPPSSNIQHRIAGLGITEAASQNLSIATPTAGIILKMNAEPGQKVEAGDILCIIDDREILTKIDSTKASLEMAKIDAEEKKILAKRYERVKNKQAISQEMRDSVKFASQRAEAKVQMLEAELRTLEVNLERIHIPAPISGEVLYINKRPGENATPNEPILVLGDTKVLNARVEFDETEALHINPKAKAFGQLRGYTKTCIPLRFVRKEAMLKPKKQFVGDGLERYDTRVQEVIYAFEKKSDEAFVGQQIQVFIERNPS